MKSLETHETLIKDNNDGAESAKKAKTRLETICKLLGPAYQGEKVQDKLKD